MNLTDILARLEGARKTGRNKAVANCPAHADSSPSLSIEIASNGTTLLHCFAGCSFEQIVRAVNLPHDTIPDTVAPEPKKSATIGDEREQRERWIQTLIAESVPLSGTPGELYLQARGIMLAVNPSDLLFHPSVRLDRETSAPAMVSVVRDIDGNVVSAHRTFLRYDKVSKIWQKLDRKLMPSPYPGCTNGATVRLGDIDERGVLGFAEGVETALAAGIIFGVPVWATISAGGMERLRIPAAAKHVDLFADFDASGVGQRASIIAIARCEAAGVTFKRHLPPVPGSDWADELLRRAAQ